MNWIRNLFASSRPIERPPLRIFHATHLRTNLPEILADGELLAFEALVRKHGFEGACLRVHDRNRYDRKRMLGEFVNCAIGRLPSSYLYRLSGQQWRMEWVAIELVPTFLEWNTISVAPVGAAKADSEIIECISSEAREAALKQCFAANVGGTSRPQFEKIQNEEIKYRADLPTHPDCELLFPSPLPREYWKAIICASPEVRNTARLLVEKSRWQDVPLKIDADVFRTHPATYARK